MMNEVYNELLTPIIYKWVSAKGNSHKCKDNDSVCFCNESYHARIDFHENNLIELSITDKKTNESLFYLHFQMHDLKTTTNNIQSFFDFLKRPTPKDEFDFRNSQKKLKILLSCTSGLTTSYYSYLMQEALDKYNHQIVVDAINYLKLDSIQDQYDYILLAPQISHLYHRLKEKYGEKVMMIDTIDFASGNVNRVLNQII